MVYFDRTDVYEGIDVNKKNASKECIICHYQYLLDVCNGCYDVLMCDP